MTTLLFLLLAAADCGPLWAQDTKPEPGDRTLLTHEEPILADEWDAQVTNANGDVTVIFSGESEEAAASKAMPLQAGDRIKTGADSSAEISFEGNSIVALRSNSDFTLQSLGRKETVFRLALGSFLAKIQSLAGTGTLSVHTPTAIAAVRGTEFGVEIAADNSQATHVGVFDEGKVEVRGTGAAGSSEMLLMNQETQVFRGQHPVAPYQLKQFARHRSTVRSMRKRMQTLRKGWKKFSPKERREARGSAIAKFKERRKVRVQEGSRKAPKQRALRPDEEKMKKFKEQIRNRRRQQP